MSILGKLTGGVEHEHKILYKKTELQRKSKAMMRQIKFV